MALVGLGVAAAAGCGSDATGPVNDRPNSGFRPGTSNQGGGPAATLVGTWQAVVVLQVPGDVQTVTTTWAFAADSTCRETRVTESLAEGFPRTADLTCTWTSSDTAVTVVFADGGTLVMSFAFDALTPDQLQLDGFQYQRQS